MDWETVVPIAGFVATLSVLPFVLRRGGSGRAPSALMCLGMLLHLVAGFVWGWESELRMVILAVIFAYSAHGAVMGRGVFSSMAREGGEREG